MEENKKTARFGNLEPGQAIIIIILAIACTLGAIKLGITNITSRIDDIRYYKDYEVTKGKITDTYKEEFIDSDDETYYRYGLIVTFETDGVSREVRTEAICQSKPFYKTVHVLYKGSDARVASREALLGAYLPVETQHDNKTIVTILLAGFAVTIWAFLIKNDKVRSWFVAIGLILIGCSGAYAFLFTSAKVLIIFLPFAFVGIYVIKAIKEKRYVGQPQ